MDELDARLHDRLVALAEAVPVATATAQPVARGSVTPGARLRGPSVIALAAVLVGAIALGSLLLSAGRQAGTEPTANPPATAPAGVAGSPSPNPSPTPSASGRTGFRGLPVDPSLQAVSPDDPAVAAALDQCVFPEQRAMVAGMAHLPGREVHRFMLTNGKEPELQTDKLVWAVQIQGDVAIRGGIGLEPVIDPLCVVIDGVAVFYAPYGSVGLTQAPLQGFVGPTAALPPLLPPGAPSPSPAPSMTRPPADVALPYPDGCAAYHLSPRRCAYIVDWALRGAGVQASEATVELLGDPDCVGEPAGCQPVRLGGGSFVVRVRVTPVIGTPSDYPVFCGGLLGSDRSLLCTDTPRITVGTPMNGYHDVPCGPQPAPEGQCASPLPSIDPSAQREAQALRIPDLTIPVDHAGPYSIDIGQAVLPNGVLSEATITLTDAVRSDLLIPSGIRLVIIGEDGRPMENAYDHGWHRGTERVTVTLVFTVEEVGPPTSLAFTDVVVR